MLKKKRLFLIDGSALAYRSYYAFIRNPLVNSKGENTSGVFGFTNAVLKLLKDYQPDYLGVVFDVGVPTFRHDRFAEYKATRPQMPEEMKVQLSWIKEVVQALSIPVLETEGYEADDVIGTLARKAKEAGLETILVTGDKDFLQLVDEEIKVLKPKVAGSEEVLYDEEKVKERFQVEPSQVVDVLGLMGDQIDNVPGVPGIGEKTAIELIKEFGSLEGVLQNADKITKKNLRESLKNYAEQAKLSKELVTIFANVPIELDLATLAHKPSNLPKLIEIFKRLEFRKLLEEISIPGSLEGVNYQLIQSEEELEPILEQIQKNQCLVLDVETTDKNPLQAQIVGISIALKKGEAFYIPLVHRGGRNLESSVFFKSFCSILENERILKIGQNLKYDLTVLTQAGLPLEGPLFDTMVASYLLDPSRRQHNLDSLSLEFLNHKMISLESLIGKGKESRTFADVPLEEAKNYSCEDADFTFRLKELFEPLLHEKGLWPLFEKIEMPLVRVLAEMEMNGVAIDIPFFREMSRKIDKDLQELEKEIYHLAGEIFNINSSRQLADILFVKLKLPPQKRIKTGYSTDVEVLEKLAEINELPRRLLDYRQLFKLKSTYIDALPQMVNSKTGRIHTSFNQTVTETGRLSSSEPNLQNIPARDELSREIRKGFVAGDPSKVLLAADYSQIELRLVASLSEDDNLVSAFRNDEDIHTQTASLVFRVSPQEVTPELRRRAKVVNFGIIYGMGPYGLAPQLSISIEEAAAFIAGYFAQYPKVKEWIDQTIAEARKNGFITTLMGRRRYLPDINSEDGNRRAFAERTAINTPIQGTAADLIKMAMISISEGFKRQNLKAKMILQVHDELLFEVPQDEVEEVSKLVKREMETPLPLKVPIKVMIGIGPNWYEAHS